MFQISADSKSSNCLHWLLGGLLCCYFQRGVLLQELHVGFEILQPVAERSRCSGYEQRAEQRASSGSLFDAQESCQLTATLCDHAPLLVHRLLTNNPIWPSHIVIPFSMAHPSSGWPPRNWLTRKSPAVADGGSAVPLLDSWICCCCAKLHRPGVETNQRESSEKPFVAA